MKALLLSLFLLASAHANQDWFVRWPVVHVGFENCSPRQQVLICQELRRQLKCPVNVVQGNYHHRDAPTNLIVSRQFLGWMTQGTCTLNLMGVSRIVINTQTRDFNSTVAHEVAHLRGWKH